MTITSKPDDDDNLIEKMTDAIGGERFVATKVLINFFDDLVRELTTTNDITKNIAILSSALSRTASTARDLQKVKQDLNTANQTIAQLVGMNGSLYAKLADHERRLKNVEQTAWR